MDRKDNMRTDGEGDDDTSKWGRTYAFEYEHTNLGSIIEMQWHDRIDRTIETSKMMAVSPPQSREHLGKRIDLRLVYSGCLTSISS